MISITNPGLLMSPFSSYTTVTVALVDVRRNRRIQFIRKAAQANRRKETFSHRMNPLRVDRVGVYDMAAIFDGSLDIAATTITS
jgi:hypothetical protein